MKRAVAAFWSTLARFGAVDPGSPGFGSAGPGGVRVGPGRLRRSGRWLSLSGFVLAGLCFALPFVTVSCDAPGGYGRAAAGATTEYSGLDLATGGRPTVDGALRPLPARQADRLPAQPLAAAGLALVVAGVVVVAAVRAVRARRGTAAVLAVAGAVTVAAAVTTAQTVVESRLGAQLTVAMPTGHTAGDYVGTGRGAALCLLSLGLLALANGVGWWRAGRPPVLAVGGGGRAPGASGPVPRRKKPVR